MASILQITNPSPDMDNRTLDNQEARNHLNDQWIHNPVDPTRVVRAGEQEEGKTGTATGEGECSIIGYESNYDVFVQGLGNDVELPRLSEQLLSDGRADALSTGQEKVGALVEQLLSSIQVDSPEALRGFFIERQAQQAKFFGPFSADLRSLLT